MSMSMFSYGCSIFDLDRLNIYRYIQTDICNKMKENAVSIKTLVIQHNGNTPITRKPFEKVSLLNCGRQRSREQNI